MTPKEEKLIHNVKLMLGGDVVKIEIPDSSIYELIGIAIDTISPYIPDTAYITTSYKKRIDMGPECEEVLRVFPASQISTMLGYGDEFNFGWNINSIGETALSAWCASDTYTLRSVFCTAARSSVPDVNISFDYDNTTHYLYVTPGVTARAITIEYIPTVHKLDDLVDSASQKWVYLYTLALAKEVIGRIRSKAKSQNVPIQLDGDTLLAEASREKEKLESALTQDALGPVTVLR